MDPNCFPGCVLEVVLLNQMRAALKGFLHFLTIGKYSMFLIEQVFTPAFVAVSYQTHELP